MKKTLAFSIIWTVAAIVGAIAIWHDADFGEQAPKVRLALTTLPLFGVWFVWWSWRRYRRYESVRVVETGSDKQFVWTELDGEEKRSATDPRITWDEEDRLDDK